MEIVILTPPRFSFRRTVVSHGWCDLPPFGLNPSTWVLTRVINLGQDRAVTVAISEARRGLKISCAVKLGKRAASKVERDVRHIMRLDEDMSPFYRATAADPDFSWIAREGAGRLLRSPTVYEDLVKMICTTNCSWGLTAKMVNGLVSLLGAQSKDGRRAFPDARTMAGQREGFYRDEIRAGYRAPYLLELAEQVAAGTLDVESWLASEMPTDELKRRMKQVKGVGDYVAENLMRLVGHYDGLALDSWLRGKFAQVRNGGRRVTDRKIERYYSRFGSWSGLALWCDMTRDWLDESRSVTW